MLLKYISFETQVEKYGKDVEKLNFIGVYARTAQSGFKPFLKPGGEFKAGGEILFGHYFNLLILEEIFLILAECKRKEIFGIENNEEKNVVNRILSRFVLIKKCQEELKELENTEIPKDFAWMKQKIKTLRLEIETFLNTRDLEKDLSYDEVLSVYPTTIRTFLNDVISDIRSTIRELTKKRFYILIDECDLLSIGQQKVLNTIIKARFTTMVFKLASRPPDIKIMETTESGIGLTDREIKKLNLDMMYNTVSRSYRDLCYRVAKRRLVGFQFPINDIRKILGEFEVEDEIGRETIEKYLMKKYPNKKRLQKLKEVYKDFKMAATFQILREKRKKKVYAGFKTFAMLSSGIMLHFLELCRDTFNLSYEKYIFIKESQVQFNKLPIPVNIQNKAAQQVSAEFYNHIEGRAKSLKDTSIEMEFGDKIKTVVSILGGIFEKKLLTFNEPEAARIEIPEGKSSLDNNLANPVRQLFDTAIQISVFQEGKRYRGKRLGGIKPPTWILNRLMAPYLGISPRPRWRTEISANVFNRILTVSPTEFKGLVLRRKRKRTKLMVKAKEVLQVPSQAKNNVFGDLKMPVISYLSKKSEKRYFEKKTFLILLHILRDIIPFLDACEKIGATPSNTILFYKKYNYPNKDSILNYLENRGYITHPLDEIDSVLRRLESEQETREVIVIEDGGHIVPKLHESFPKLADFVLGAVEQTTRGTRLDRKIKNLKFPVISIPDSELKKRMSHLMLHGQLLIIFRDFSQMSLLVERQF